MQTETKGIGQCRTALLCNYIHLYISLYVHRYKHIAYMQRLFFCTILYKKGLNDPDNYDGVLTHLEPDTLEYEVKWALGSITMNKASRGEGIPVELFQILKDDAVKVLH